MKSFTALPWIAAPAICLAVGVYAMGEHHEHKDHKDHEGHHQADHDGEHHSDHAGEAGWFDPEHCDICKPMHERPDVMITMKWDAHKIVNGMLMTTSVPEEKKADFYIVIKKMHTQGQGENSKLCGFCKGLGEVIEAGARVEEVKTDFGMITVVSATDPVVISKIHAVADRSIKEMAKMVAGH